MSPSFPPQPSGIRRRLRSAARPVLLLLGPHQGPLMMLPPQRGDLTLAPQLASTSRLLRVALLLLLLVFLRGELLAFSLVAERPASHLRSPPCSQLQIWLPETYSLIR